MIILEPLERRHLDELGSRGVQPFQKEHEANPATLDADAVLALGPATAALWQPAPWIGARNPDPSIGGGEVVGVGGLAHQWPGRAIAWCYLAPDAGRCMVALSRLVKREIEASGITRIEAYADCGFAQAHRWLALLGFACEAPRMRGFTPDRRDGALFARVAPRSGPGAGG